MATSDPDAPSVGRRALAVLALLSTVALVVAMIAFLVHDLLWLIVALIGLAIATAGIWWALTERRLRRAVGLAVLVGGVLIIREAIVQAIEGSRGVLPPIATVVAALAVAAVAARAALAPDPQELDRLRAVKRVHPRKPVLLCNPRSGGGKVARFGLADIAAEMGVEVVMLEKGLDLAELARDAVARGADCLGMAGGDGSQALVASIAHEHDIPFVCISAGTRNHFAQDLGFHKEDPRKGMVAFREGVERFIDYGTVGDRLFVNNVSMGVYATVVQQDSYRDAKIKTSRQMLPEMLSHQAEPFDLQFTTPDGVEIDDAFVVQVSNNPYVWEPAADFAQRRTLDSGRLGIFAINARTGGEAAEIATRAATGLPRHDDPYFHEFTAETFEVRSRGGTAFAGIDGEALELETPLEFRIHPRALRLLVPEDVLVRATKRRARGYSLTGLLAVARGHWPAAPPGDGAEEAGRGRSPRRDHARIAVTAVGFDLGETLYHHRHAPMRWLERGRPAIERVVDAFGVDRSKARVATGRKSPGRHSTYLRERVRRVAASKVVTDVSAAFFERFRTSLEAYPGAVETLATLKESGFTVGALTNVPPGMPRRTIQRDLERLGLAPYIDGFVTSFEVGLRKPHRAAFERLAATLAVDLPDIAYVGNLPTDVTGALAAGCVPIFLDRTERGIDYGQAATVHHLLEIPSLLTLAADGARANDSKEAGRAVLPAPRASGRPDRTAEGRQ